MSVERIILDSDSTHPDVVVVRDIATGNIAIDYSKYYERMATSVEAIAADIDTIKTLADVDGIAVKDPLGWIGLMSVYKLYAEDGSGNVDPVKLEALKAYKAKLDALVASLG